MASASVDWGTPDRGRAELERRRETADSMLVSPPFRGIPAERIGHWAEAIRRDALAGSA